MSSSRDQTSFTGTSTSLAIAAASTIYSVTVRRPNPPPDLVRRTVTALGSRPRVLAIRSRPRSGVCDVIRRRIVEVDAAVNGMATLIDQFLEDSEQALGATLPLHVNDHLRAMLSLFEASVDRNVRFRYELDEELPSIEVDPAQVRHAVRQLISPASIIQSRRVEGCTEPSPSRSRCSESRVGAKSR